MLCINILIWSLVDFIHCFQSFSPFWRCKRCCSNWRVKQRKMWNASFQLEKYNCNEVTILLKSKHRTGWIQLYSHSQWRHLFHFIGVLQVTDFSYIQNRLNHLILLHKYQVPTHGVTHKWLNGSGSLWNSNWAFKIKMKIRIFNWKIHYFTMHLHWKFLCVYGSILLLKREKIYGGDIIRSRPTVYRYNNAIK